MQEIHDISLDWRDFLFDLYITEQRAANWNSLRGKDKYQQITALALKSILKNPNNPDISFDALERILLETQKSRVAVLEAEGMESPVWYYQDGNKLKGVQNWINGVENNGYGAIVISACNPGGVEPSAEKTPIFYAKGWINTEYAHTSHLTTP